MKIGGDFRTQLRRKLQKSVPWTFYAPLAELH
jgi:hypothetical protein